MKLSINSVTHKITLHIINQIICGLCI